MYTTLLRSILAAFKPMKLKIGTHIAICKTSNRTKGFCAATLHHGDIRDLVVRASAFVQSIINNELRISGAERREAISREILWYIPLYYQVQLQQQHAYQFSESAVGTGHRYHQLKYKVVYKNTLRVSNMVNMAF